MFLWNSRILEEKIPLDYRSLMHCHIFHLLEERCFLEEVFPKEVFPLLQKNLE